MTNSDVHIEIDLMLEKAIIIAHRAHDGQYRKINCEPYINHPMRVAGKMPGKLLKIVAWLHDVVEDSDFSLSDLKKECGLQEIHTTAIHALTKQNGENYFDYIKNLADNEIARQVKLADLKDNIRDLKEGSMKDKYRFALDYLEKIQGGKI